jgi:hypothetical protein
MQNWEELIKIDRRILGREKCIIHSECAATLRQNCRRDSLKRIEVLVLLCQQKFKRTLLNASTALPRSSQ